MKVFKTILNTIPRPLLIKISIFINPFLDLLYRGNNYIDPINGKKYSAFLPYGYGNQRENVLAPGTLSLERHRLMWLYLKNHTSFFKDQIKVLHIAPEQCFHKRFKKLSNINYTTADLFSPLADIKADICNLPFDNHSFDIIFCNHVLEHIEDDSKAMNELYRVLKPNGWGIFQVPQNTDLEVTYEDSNITTPEERKIHFGQYDHVRVYGLDYFNRLENAGFEVNKFKVSDKFSEEEIKHFALMENEILPICYKF